MSDDAITFELPAKRSRWFWIRVGVSVFFALLTVALCVLWVRSYWTLDVLIRDAPEEQQVTSSLGKIRLSWRKQVLPGTLRTKWSWETYPQKTLASKSFVASQTSYPGFPAYPRSIFPQLVRSIKLSFVSIPYWTLTLLTLVLSVGPAFSTVRHIRFSLRTLLIITTLVAVVLGLVVWMVT
ncbi:MAG: hypothetical protein AB7G28_18850 [Pirellulales bacterium]